MDLREAGFSKNRHPWELSRTDNILSVIGKYIGKTNMCIADIGGGDLYFSRRLVNKYDCKVIAVDTAFQSESKNEKITLLNDISKIQNNSIDIAVMMDVLEHIEKPEEFLSILVNEKVKKGGIFIITVPAFQHLFSSHDVFLKHYRRYSKKSLKRELKYLNINIITFFYFYSSLYIARIFQLALSKLFVRKESMVNNITSWKYKQQSMPTKIIRAILNMDFKINSLMKNFSFFGLSLFLIFKTSKEQFDFEQKDDST